MRKFHIFCIYILLIVSAVFTAQSLDAPRLALVLSGGGSRGLAQIGVLKALEENDIKPDLIVATSMGAIIGSLYSVGVCADTLKHLANSIDWEQFFSNEAERKSLLVSQKAEPVNYLFELRFDKDLTPKLPNSFSYGQSFFSFLTPRFVSPLFYADVNFDSLPIALRVVSTDIITGKLVVFSKGNLSAAVRASCGIPLAFSPVKMDSLLLLDGGLTANIPVKPAVEKNAEFIVAVDVTSPLSDPQELDNPVRLVNQVVAISIEKQKKNDRGYADVTITPELGKTRNTDFSQIDHIIEQGYQSTLQMIPQIQTCLKKIDATGLDTSSTPVSHHSALPLPISFRCEDNQLSESLKSLEKKFEGKTISSDTLDAVLQALFAQTGHTFATYTTSVGNNRTILSVEPGKIHDIVVEGNTGTTSYMILKAANLKRGAFLKKGMIEKGIGRLYATGLFNTADMYMDSSSVLHILVQEKEYWRTRFGLRFDQYHLGEGYVQPAYENLFGMGICALLHLQYGIRREKYAFELQGSSLFSPALANNALFQAYLSRERVTDTVIVSEDTSDTAVYESVTRYAETSLRKAGLLLMAGAQLGRTMMISGGLRIEKFSLSRSGSEGLDLWSASNGNPLGGYRDGIRYLFLRLNIDNLDRFPFPRYGQKHYITVGGASDIIGGTESFVNLSGNLRLFYTLGERHTISPHIQFAWADKSLPAVERIYLGGIFPEEKYRDLSVYNYIPFTGLKPRSLPGDIMAVMSGSYTFCIQKNSFITTTLDWGYVWQQPDFSFDSKTARKFVHDAPLGVGIAFAYQSFFGPIQIAWGRLIRTNDKLKNSYGIKEENILYFSAGYDF
ncbi:MAG: patatin-like phospholipase family protein [Chitinispirillaceae bacterium]